MPMRFIKRLCQDTIKLLRRIHKYSQFPRTRNRAQCILLSYLRHSVQDLAETFNVTTRTIYNWLDAWDSSRFTGLYDQQGQGIKVSLHPAKHKNQIKTWLEKFPKQLQKVCLLIKEKYNISIGKKALQNFIKKYIDFSWRRIRKKTKGEPDPEVYKEKKDELERLEDEAKAGQHDVYYMDESGFSLTSDVPYAWQEKGIYIEVKTSSSRRLNVLGLLNINSEEGLIAYTFECSITSEVVIACIDTFCETVTRKSIFVIDNASIHTSYAFKNKIPEWEKMNVFIFRLPTYSPQLNLIEIVWRFMKYEWIEVKAYECWQSLVDYVEKVIVNYGQDYKINFKKSMLFTEKTE